MGISPKFRPGPESRLWRSAICIRQRANQLVSLIKTPGKISYPETLPPRKKEHPLPQPSALTLNPTKGHLATGTFGNHLLDESMGRPVTAHHVNSARKIGTAWENALQWHRGLPQRPQARAIALSLRGSLFAPPGDEIQAERRVISQEGLSAEKRGGCTLLRPRQFLALAGI
jgi:hypothetical protein